MAANIDALANFLGGIFTNQEVEDSFNENQAGVLAQAGFGDATAVDVEQAAQRVFAPDNTTFVGGGGGGGGAVPFPLPDGGSSSGGTQGAIEAIQHYQTTYSTLVENENFDLSNNNNITAFGNVDLNQNIDQNVATGDGAVAGVEDSQVQTGDGIQVGDDVEDSNLVAGDVEESVLADDISDSQVLAGSTVEDSNLINDSNVEDSVLGDADRSIVGSDVDDSAIVFGDGDATNVQADQANVGDGNVLIGDDLDGNANFGSGDQVVVQDSELDESAVGIGNTVQSNDIDVDADDGAAVSFGDGDAQGQNTNIEDVDGNVAVAGDDALIEDNDINDSFNTEIDDSFNTETEVDDSFNEFETEVEDSEDVNVGQAGEDVDLDA